MKKNLKLMLAMMIAAFMLASCSDVPSPYSLFAGNDDEIEGASGSGTLEDPFNVPGVLNYIKTLEAGAQSDVIYVKGIVSRLVEGQNYDAGYGNGTFYISIDGEPRNQFEVYRALYLENQQYVDGPIANIGDEVIICGKVTMHGTTPETVDKEAYLYSINGMTHYESIVHGSAENPLTVAQATEIIQTLDNNTSAGNGYVKGIVCKVDQFTASSGKLTYYISADGKNTNAIQVYKGLGLEKAAFKAQTDLTVGDEVVVFGPLYKYVNGNTGATTIEINDGNYLISLKKSEGGGGSGETATPSGDGTVNNPYNAAAAIQAVKDLTWTSNTEYQTTDNVYIKGKVVSISQNYDYQTFGTATYYIADEGSEGTQFQIYRSLYLNNVTWTSGAGDVLKVGDKVVVYGKLMNYGGNTPETVQNASYLYSLNSGDTGGGDTGGGEQGGDGTSVSFNTNAGTQTWAAATDGTYGAGFSTTVQGLTIGYYKHTSTSNPVAPNDSHVRIYKNSVLSITAPTGKTIKKIVIGTAPNSGSTSYCFDMVGLEGGANATADTSALTVTWTGSANKVVLHATGGQVRMEKLSVELE